jgi:cysteine sulfinate desulfinase/cysteine desulfurase-like protein
MGLSEDEAYASVRFSFSELNTIADVNYVVEDMSLVVKQLRQFPGASMFAA